MNADCDRAVPNRFRLFFALTVPDPVKAELSAVQLALAREAGAARIAWTRPEQLHLTLRFLGDVEVDRLPALTTAATRALARFGPLELYAQEIGFFPARARPRVIWAGVRDITGQLPSLQQALQAATLPFTTEPPEERFCGHLTLGRVKALERRGAPTLQQTAEKFSAKQLGHWKVQAMNLFRSELSSQGAKHSVLATFGLTNPAPGSTSA